MKSAVSKYVPSSCLQKGNKIIECIRKNLTACEELSIDVYVGTSKINSSDTDQITGILSKLNFWDISDLFQEMQLGDVSDISSSIDFHLDQLMIKTESTCQKLYLTPLADPNSNIFDTHVSNAIAQFLCVSPPSNGVFQFNTKPDLIHGKAPVLLEIKSRVVGESKQPKMNNVDTSSVLSNDLDNLTLRRREPLPNITLVELDLFQQCVERIVEQVQFRGYLSKFVVLGSTGHTSWCFYYTQTFDDVKGSIRKQLVVRKVTSSDINAIWNGINDCVQSLGSSFYLTKHAPAIANTLAYLYPNHDLHSIRIHVAGVSHATVYYVTPPIAGEVYAYEKQCALKVISDRGQFEHEVTQLEKIKSVWDQYQTVSFYYKTNSDVLKSEVLKVSSKPYSWFEASNNDNNHHIIVMQPALKNKLWDLEDTSKAYSDLLRSLSVAHNAGILHCDVSPNNCLQFMDGSWQVVDYGLSVQIEKREPDWMTSSGYVTILKNSFQHLCCGYRAFDIISGFDRDLVEFEWTIGDDLEMLQRACSKER